MKYLKVIGTGLLLIVLGHGLWSVFAPSAVEAPATTSEEVSAGSAENTKAETATTTEGEPSAVPSSPTSEQAKALEAVGIDSTDLSFSAAEVACFREVLGETRVAEIIAGAVPNPLELYKAKDCLGR